MNSNSNSNSNNNMNVNPNSNSNSNSSNSNSNNNMSVSNNNEGALAEAPVGAAGNVVPNAPGPAGNVPMNAPVQMPNAPAQGFGAQLPPNLIPPPIIIPNQNQNMEGGRRRKASRKSRKVTRKSRKASRKSRKGSRKSRKTTRKGARKSRKGGMRGGVLKVKVKEEGGKFHIVEISTGNKLESYNTRAEAAKVANQINFSPETVNAAKKLLEIKHSRRQNQKGG